MAWIKVFFSWPVKKKIFGDLVFTSCAAGLDWPSKSAKKYTRQRVLNHDEIRDIWHAASSLGYPGGDFIKLLLLTGARRNEVARMTWSEISFDKREWNLPGARAKNKADFVVPLSDMAVDLLESIERRGPFVFAHTGGPISDFSRIKSRVVALLPAEIADWRFHDLRRSAATEWNRLRIDLEVRRTLLNHAKARLDGTYDRHDLLDEKRAALAAWARKLGEIVNETVAENVVPLRQ